MPGVLPLSPFPVFADAHQQEVQANATLTASGSSAFTGYGDKEITLVVNVLAAPTGTLPTLQYTLQEVDPGDGITVFGQTVSTVSITAVGVYEVTIRATLGGTLKVSWAVGGTLPSFTQVYATLVSKATTASTGVDASGVERPILVDSSAREIVVGPGVAGTPAGGVLSVQGVVGGTALPISGSITATNPSVGSNAAAAPTSSTQVGGTDGVNLQAAHVFDADTGAGSQYVLGTVLRKSASGGSVEAGTATDPLRVDPTGTTAQPVTDNGGSLTVDTPQLPAALVGGRLDVVVGAALPAGTNNIGDVDVLTVPAPLSTTGGGTEATALRVTVANDSTGVLSVDDNGGSLTVDGTVTANQGTAAATAGAWPTKVTDGTNTAAVKAASTAAVAADPALVVVVSPNNSVAITAASLPLPTGAATAANQTTLGNQTTKINDGTNTAAVTAASTAAVATDPALVVAISPNNTVSITGGKSNNNVAPGATNLGTLPAIANAANPTWTEGNQVGLSVSLSGALRVVQNAAGLLANWWAVRVTDGTNTMPTADVAARSLFARITDGTNTAAVKASATAPASTDPALVVTQSPNDRSVVASAATLTNVASSATSVSLLAANTARYGVIVYNDSNQTLYLKYGTTASTTSFTYLLTPKATWEMPFPIYQGAIDGIWSSANGAARITELT